MQKKNEIETISCSQLKTETVLMDDSMYMAIIPMAVEVEVLLSVHQH